MELTDRPYGDRLSPTGEELLRSALTYAVGGDAGKVNSTKPFQGLPIFSHKLRANLLEHLLKLITNLTFICPFVFGLTAKYYSYATTQNDTPLDVCKGEERNKHKRVRQIGQPSVPSVTNKENSCGCLSPQKRHKSGRIGL